MCVLKRTTTTPISNDLLTLFTVLDDLESDSYYLPGLVGKIGSFLKGKSIPSLTSIQCNVKFWWKSFKDYLSESSVVPLFGYTPCA